jgi:hypothetical protein
VGCTEGARARCPPIAKWISETREEIFDIFWIEDSPAQRVRNKRDDSVFAIPRHGTRSGARAMLAPGASAGLGSRGGAPARSRGGEKKARARCVAAYCMRKQGTCDVTRSSVKPWVRLPKSTGLPFTETRRRRFRVSAKNTTPDGFGTFGGFQDSNRRVENGWEGGNDGTDGDDGSPQSSGDFSPRKLSAEISKRNLGIVGNESESLEKQQGSEIPFGKKQALNVQYGVLDKNNSGGMLDEITAARNRSPLINSIVKRFGAGGQFVFALALSLLIWVTPTCMSALMTVGIKHVPVIAQIVSAFSRLTSLGVGFDLAIASACFAATFKIVVLWYAPRVSQITASTFLPPLFQRTTAVTVTGNCGNYTRHKRTVLPLTLVTVCPSIAIYTTPIPPTRD